MDVVVRHGMDIRRTCATGRDIYAVTAPIAVEGAASLLDGRHRGAGAAAPGEAFDAADVLVTLERDACAIAVRSAGPPGEEKRCSGPFSHVSETRAPMALR